MKNQFIIAYCSMYGASKKKAAQVYRESSEEYKKAIIEGFKAESTKAFYND